MGNRTRGFTLIELITGVTVMLVILGVSRIGLVSGEQSAGREAEKIAAYLAGLVQKSERLNVSLEAKFDTEGKIIASLNGIQESPFNINSTCTCTPHLNLANISDTKTKTWTYAKNPGDTDSYYPNGVHIFATDSLNDTLTLTGGSTITYDYGKNGHRYLQIEDRRQAKYYVVITSKDIMK